VFVWLTTHQRNENVAKASTAEAVNDEVDRRIGDDQQVADSDEEEIGKWTE